MTADDEFASVLEHLREVREQLSGTSSPEKVARLRATATELLDRGQRILGRHLGPGASPAGVAPDAGAAFEAPTDPYPISERDGPAAAASPAVPAGAAPDAPTEAVPQVGSGSVRVLRPGGDDASTAVLDTGPGRPGG